MAESVMEIDTQSQEKFIRKKIERGWVVRSKGIYLLNSFYDQLLAIYLPKVFPLLGLLIVLAFIGNPYLLVVIAYALVYAILGISWCFLLNYGLVSLGHSILLGIPAYMIAVLWKAGTSLTFAVIVGIPCGAAISYSLFLILIRLRGIYFAIASLTYPLIIGEILSLFPRVTGGSEGITGIFFPLSTKLIVMLAAVVICLMVYITKRFNSSLLGMVCKATTDDDIAGASLGFSWIKIRAIVLLLACFMASVSSFFYISITHTVAPSLYGLELTLFPIIAALVGTADTVFGPLLGSFLLLGIMEVLRIASIYRIVFLSGILIVIIFLRPRGILAYLGDIYYTKNILKER